VRWCATNRHGGYGDTSGIPSLAPEPERGAAAVAALTAVLESSAKPR
jgi:cell division transport system ATP-binding protein